MVKHTHTHTHKQLHTCRGGLVHFKSSHISSCRHPRTVSRLGKHKSQSTDPEPFKRNVLFSVRDVLSGLVWLLSTVACWISSDLNVIGHRVAHSQLYSLQIVLSLPACECLTLYLCQSIRILGEHLEVSVCVCLYLDAYSPSSAYVHFNLKSRLVAMETPANVPLVENNGLAYCTLYFIALQTRKQHLSTLQHIRRCVACSWRFMFSFTSSVISHIGSAFSFPTPCTTFHF